ncbi:hypothetical protein CKA32_002466 [Geitlerinema sp. FC II]|nr:hypothetical protein CKA32_002466 [Geitlerinema sp. FC II]
MYLTCAIATPPILPLLMGGVEGRSARCSTRCEGMCYEGENVPNLAFYLVTVG